MRFKYRAKSRLKPYCGCSPYTDNVKLVLPPIKIHTSPRNPSNVKRKGDLLIMPLSDVTVWSSVEIFTGLQPPMRQVKTDYVRTTHSHVTSHICSWSLTADYFSTFGFSQVASLSRNNNCVRAFERCPQRRRRTEGLKLVERVRSFM